MTIYINANRAHDQAQRTRRYSENRAEWYDSLRRSFLQFCDRLANDSPYLAGFRNLEHFRQEGLAVIEVNREFWHEHAELGEDDPFAEFRTAMNDAIDPNMTLEEFAERVKPPTLRSYGSGPLRRVS